MSRPLDDFVTTISALRGDMPAAGLSVAILILAHEVDSRIEDPAESRRVFDNILARMTPSWRASA